jgi:hypothetical protein
MYSIVQDSLVDVHRVLLVADVSAVQIGKEGTKGSYLVRKEILQKNAEHHGSEISPSRSPLEP